MGFYIFQHFREEISQELLHELPLLRNFLHLGVNCLIQPTSLRRASSLNTSGKEWENVPQKIGDKMHCLGSWKKHVPVWKATSFPLPITDTKKPDDCSGLGCGLGWISRTCHSKNPPGEALCDLSNSNISHQNQTKPRSHTLVMRLH